MAAFTANQASVSNGLKVVTINSGESIANVRQGDFLFLAGFLVEVNRGYVGGSSQQYIELVKNWANSNQSNQPAVVIPTTGDFRAAVNAINNANKNVNDNFVAMQNWQTNMGSVTFVNQDGTTTTVKTLKQIEAENSSQMDAYHPYPWAMRKVEFEARRAANNEKFAASGFVHFGKHGAGNNFSIINQGLMTSGSSGLSLDGQIGLGVGSQNSSNALGDSTTRPAMIHISGVISKLEMEKTDAYGVRIKLPPAEDGTRTYDRATGISITHATPAIAFASETTTNKVVTDRVDMWGFEALLREINDADPFVYANGLIQSLATSINGVTTVNDNVRPITYFAWYEGDESSRGKGVNWQTATEAQRIVIASNPENNIYFDDKTGKFYQWCIRGRSFAGAGNGDWSFVESNILHAGYNTYSRLKVQGMTDNDTAFEGNSSFSHYRGYIGTSNNNPSVGCFTGHSATANSRAVNGEVYFLICSTVNRLNQGAYHPLNMSGTARIFSDTHETNSGIWSSTGRMAINSKADCFDIGGFPNTGLAHKVAGHTGFISTNASGRPDGRYFDAIYASGQGGVCRDMRYSAWGLTQEDFAMADLAIKSGEYRGCELLKFTRVFSSVAAVESGYTIVNQDTAAAVVALKVLETSVAAEFLYTEVIGDPANILLCDALKDGWFGSWIPIIPDGVVSEYPLTRPKATTVSSIPRTYTTDLGSTWLGSTAPIVVPKNTITGQAYPSGYIGIVHYESKAKNVGKSVNLSPYKGELGVGKLWATSFYAPAWGNTLCFSCTDKILKNPLNSGIINVTNQLISISIRPDNKAIESATDREPKHAPLDLVAYSGELGFKALGYNTVLSQQGFINYAYTELMYDATAGDWGDDSKIHIVENQATMLDENGNTVLVGTARIVEPLGWIKNDK